MIAYFYVDVDARRVVKNSLPEMRLWRDSFEPTESPMGVHVVGTGLALSVAAPTKNFFLFIAAIVPASLYECTLTDSGGFPVLYAVVLVVVGLSSLSVRSLPVVCALNLLDLGWLSTLFFLVIPALRGLLSLAIREPKSATCQSEVSSPVRWFSGRLFAFFLSAVLIGVALFPGHRTLMEHFAYGEGVSFFGIVLFVAALWTTAATVSASIFAIRFFTCQRISETPTLAIASGYSVSFTGACFWYFWPRIGSATSAAVHCEGIILVGTAVFAVTAAAAHTGWRSWAARKRKELDQ
jgi:hypothetical protein